MGQLLDIVVMTLLPTNIMAGQVLEFSIFAVIMLLDMVVLAFLARKYTYIEDLNKQWPHAMTPVNKLIRQLINELEFHRRLANVE